MIERDILPQALIDNIGNENKDFWVKASRSQPLRNSLGILLFGIFWLAFTSIFVTVFLGPLFSGNEVHFTSNDMPVVASRDNLKPLILPGLVIGLFVLVGVALLGFGLYLMQKKGGYYVGTPTRLVNYYRGTIRSIDWEQFSGDITVSGTEIKGSITLGMRTGKMVSSKNAPERYVPDTLYISGIPDVYEVERVCRKRIKENDPTPPVA